MEFKLNPDVDKLRSFMENQVSYLEELKKANDTDELSGDVLEELVDAFIEIPQDFWSLWNDVSR